MLKLTHNVKLYGEKMETNPKSAAKKEGIRTQKDESHPRLHSATPDRSLPFPEISKPISF